MRALDYAAGLAKKLNAQIHLVYVQTPDEACAVPNAGHLMRECAESVTFLREQPRELNRSVRRNFGRTIVTSAPAAPTRKSAASRASSMSILSS